MIFLVTLCQLLVILALEMVNPFIPSYVKLLGQTDTQQIAFISALIVAAPLLGMIIMSPIWGRLSDRFGYKTMLVRASLALGLSLLITPWVTTLNQLLVLRFIQGCFAGFLSAMQCYALHHITCQDRTSILAKLQTSKAIGSSLGAIIGGVIIAFIGLTHSFYVASLFAFIALFIIIVYLPNTSIKLTTPVTKATKQYLAFPVISLAIMIFLSQVAKFIPAGNFAIYVDEFLTGNPIVIGMLYSIPALSIYCGSTLCAKKFNQQCKKAQARQCRQPIINYFLAISLSGLILGIAHFYFTHLVIISFIRFGLGLIFAALLPALIALFSSQQRYLGLAIGLANSCAKLGNLSGLLLGGYLASMMPLNYLYVFVALSYFALALTAMGQTQAISQPGVTQ